MTAGETTRVGSSQRGARWDTEETAVVLLLTVGFAGMAIYRLGEPSLWLDEGASWAIAGRNLGALFDAIGNFEPNGSAYYFSLHWWIDAFGDSEAAMRSLSIVFAAATIAPFFALARRLLPSSRVAIAATALYAVTPFVQLYAREARMYTLALLFTVLASYAFIRAIEEASTVWWVFWAVFIAAGASAHLFVGFVAIAHLASLVALPRDVVPRFHVARGVALLGFLCVPLGVLVVSAASGNVDWIAPLNTEQLSAYVNSLTATTTTLRKLPWIAVGAAALFAVRAMVRREGARSVATWHLAFAFALLLVPLVGTIAISTVKPLFVDRYLIVTVPGFVLVLAFTLSWLDTRRRGALVFGTAVLIAFSVWNMPSFSERSPSYEDWRATAAHVAHGFRPGDTIVLTPGYTITAFGYYARRSRILGARDVQRLPDLPWDVKFATAIGSRVVASTSVVPTNAGRHVWLVERHTSGFGTATEVAAFRHALEAASSRIERHYFGGAVAVWRYTLRAKG